MATRGRGSMARVERSFPEGRRIGRVVAVDDNPDVVGLYSRLAAACGLEFAGVTNPAGVVKLLSAEGADLLVIDLVMPVLDGAQLLRAVRREGLVLPVVVAAPHGISDEERVRLLEWGASEVLEKPLDEGSFAAAVMPYFGGGAR